MLTTGQQLASIVQQLNGECWLSLVRLASREVLEWPYTIGGGVPGTPHPPKTKVTIVGNNDRYNRENLVGPFLVHTSLPPPPSLDPRSMHATATP